jgi:hypothetical protein
MCACPPTSPCLMAAAYCLQDAAGASRGSGIVEFERSADALHAISMLSNSMLGGRQIHVRRAQAQQQRAGRQLSSTASAQRQELGGWDGCMKPGVRYLRLMWPHRCCTAVLGADVLHTLSALLLYCRCGRIARTRLPPRAAPPASRHRRGMCLRAAAAAAAGVAQR